MNVSRSLTHDRFGMLSVFSSRTDSITCRELAVDHVAVVVDVLEVVVRPDLLDLRERLQQRLVIPEPDVLDRAGVVDDVARRQLGVAGELAFLDAIERRRPPRRGDVVLDERLFLVLLVRRHDEALDEAAVHAADDRDRDVERHRERQRPGRAC